MIPTSRVAAIVAIMLATTAHGLALLDVSTPERTRIEGGGSVKVAALGSSFKDLAAGTTVTAPTRATHQPQTAAQQQPAVRPEQVSPASPSQNLQPAGKQNVAVAQALTKAHQQPPRQAQVAAQTATTPGLAPVQDAQAKPRLRPERPQTPKVSPEAEATPKPQPEPKAAPEPKPQIASRQGNAQNSARKGTETGETSIGSANARQSASASTSQGNAAATNYAGLVKRKILRARRRSVNIRGTARVTFQIADNGSLVSTAIIRSSGSKRLDQVALAQVQAAAPFPRPPQGARRRFTIEIVGR